MKRNNSLLLILWLVLVLFSGCKKTQLSTEDEYFLENKTDDTLFVNYEYETGDVINPYDTTKVNYKLLSFQKIKIPFLSLLNNNNEGEMHECHYIYLNIIYKNHNIRFKPDSLPYNYNKDFFNINNWENTYRIFVDEYKYGNKKIQHVEIYYTFTIDTLNISGK